MENDFQIKEIKVRERIAFWNEGNCKETKLVETSGTKKNIIIWNGNFVRGTFPRCTMELHLVPLWMFFTVSMILADFHPDKLPSFLNRCQECQKGYHEFGAKLIEIKVMEINALLNNWHRITVYKNYHDFLKFALIF